METYLKLTERFKVLMKKTKENGSLKYEKEWFSLLSDMHEYLKDKTIPKNIRRQFEPLGMLETTMMVCDGIHYKKGTGRYAKKEE